MSEINKSIFRNLSQTGVIYVTTRAIDAGYTSYNNEWSNLGQGAPETGLLSKRERIKEISLNETSYEYGGVLGDISLRKKIAELYNALYRKKMNSQYTYENVAIAAGGRIALARILSIIENVNLAHFLPDYTAYEQLLTMFDRITPIPFILEKENGYEIDVDVVEKDIKMFGIRAMLMSNPSNPTGKVIKGPRLEKLVNIAKENDILIISDEFYSFYIYGKTENDIEPPVSAAKYIDNVNEDNIVIIDGLTKNWRYPGLRLSWTLAPKHVIKKLSTVASFLDGGAPLPLQKVVNNIMDETNALEEAEELQKHFIKKRNYSVNRLKEIGIDVKHSPESTFYIWANLDKLPHHLQNSEILFEECLKEKVIVVPGHFFDINPHKRRSNINFNNYIRISFGPEMESLKRGFSSLERVISKHRNSF